MNIADALASKTYANGDLIIRQVYYFIRQLTSNIRQVSYFYAINRIMYSLYDHI